MNLTHPNPYSAIETQLSQRGSVYESLRHYDQVQKSCLKQIESVLIANKIKFVTVDRFGYTEDKIEWADVIVTSGGDGTFLMAASKVTSRDKPVIGVNSDPTKSVGHLCLPSYYSDKFDKVLELLKEGKYQWQYKQRLRVTLIGEASEEEAKELNDIRYELRGINQILDQEDSQDQQSPATTRMHRRPLNYRWPVVLPPNSTTTSMSQSDNSDLNHHQHQQPMNNTSSLKEPQSSSFQSVGFQANPLISPFAILSASKNDSTVSSDDHRMDCTPPPSDVVKPKQPPTRTPYKTVDGRSIHKIRQLKERALNEVFVGETLSARVSYYELSVDNNRLTKMKSSGLTVCTGTGSTSWYFNINKMTEHQLQSIASIINKVTGTIALPPNDTELIGEITKQFNDTLTFSASEPIMAYSIRDPVDYASAMGHDHRGYAKRIEVKSRMQNACLVLDGCQFYPFNDGSYALIEIYDEDALKTVSVELA